MSLSIAQLGELPSPYYRVALKALIFDDEQRLLVLENDDGLTEIPGGGWEHGESIDECLERELAEELHGRLATRSGIDFTYQGQSDRGWHVLRLVVRAELVSLDDISPDDEMRAIRFVTREEFAQLEWASPERPIAAFAATIWGEAKE